MLTPTDIIYYFVYLVCLVFSFIKTGNLKGIAIIRSVLILGLANELFVEWLQYLGKEENFSHFIYIPAEYFLLCFFYLQHTQNRIIRHLIIYSLPVYLLAVFFLSLKVYSFETYPSIIYNIGCILSTIWLTLIMFNIDIVDNKPLVQIPVFWLFSGLLIFYAGVYFFNTAYAFLIADSPSLAWELRIYINLGLNIILYTSWTYAFICSAKMKNYIYH